MVLAEREGFEPSVHCCTLVFETSQFNHSCTSPQIFNHKGSNPGISTHLRRARRNCFANKFASVDSLAKCYLSISHLGALLHTCFRDKPVQPLLHLSTLTLIILNLWLLHYFRKIYGALFTKASSSI